MNMQQLELTRMTKGTIAPGPSGARQMSMLSRLPPATDEEAGATAPPTLGLTEHDMARLHDLSEAWGEAKATAVEAEQRLSEAQREADQLPKLRAQAGEAAARAFGMNGHGKAFAGRAADKIDAAKLAASALPTLQREVDLARAAAARARGRLYTATVGGVQMAIRRAAVHWSALALQQTQVIAAIQACVGVLPSRMTSQDLSPCMNLFMSRLAVPALGVEFGPADRSAVEHGAIAVLLDRQHPRLTNHTTAASGWLHQQLAEALGFDPHSLLI